MESSAIRSSHPLWSSGWCVGWRNQRTWASLVWCVPCGSVPRTPPGTLPPQRHNRAGKAARERRETADVREALLLLLQEASRIDAINATNSLSCSSEGLYQSLMHVAGVSLSIRADTVQCDPRGLYWVPFQGIMGISGAPRFVGLFFWTCSLMACTVSSDPLSHCFISTCSMLYQSYYKLKSSDLSLTFSDVNLADCPIPTTEFYLLLWPFVILSIKDQ